jgi:hypothetical protein
MKSGTAEGFAVQMLVAVLAFLVTFGKNAN